MRRSLRHEDTGTTIDDHYDHNQTLVPGSFLAIWSRHGRALAPRADIEARHELCEDVALHAAALLAGRHADGDDTDEALQRCHDGLRADAAAFSAAEAAWIVARIAELQGWDVPDWLQALQEGEPPTRARTSAAREG